MHKNNSTSVARRKGTKTGRRPTLITNKEDVRWKRSEARWQVIQHQVTELTERLIAHHDELSDTAEPSGRIKWDTTQAKVRHLIERILVHEDNDQGLALVALLDLLTHEREGDLDREAIGDMAMDHAFTNTIAFHNFASAFRSHALNMADVDDAC